MQGCRGRSPALQGGNQADFAANPAKKGRRQDYFHPDDDQPGKAFHLKVNAGGPPAAANRAVKELDILKMAVAVSIYRRNAVILPRRDMAILERGSIPFFSVDDAKEKTGRLFGPKDWQSPSRDPGKREKAAGCAQIKTTAGYRFDQPGRCRIWAPERGNARRQRDAYVRPSYFKFGAGMVQSCQLWRKGGENCAL